MSEQVHKLGDVLRSAREAKGVDLERVERETKIRSRYLSALERSEYRELPGAVYTKGFLRNYGLYLGLDTEYLVDLYRLESAGLTAERRARTIAPRPLAARGARAFVVTPNAIVAAIMTLLVVLFVGYLGWQFYTFAGTPELRITEPPGDVAAYRQTEMTIRGTTVANARIAVDDLRENPSLTADAQGHFEVLVRLVPGSNVITLTASDPVTGRNSEPQSRVINVVGADPGATSEPVAITLSQPVADATTSAPVTIAGTAAPAADLVVGATFIAPVAIGFSVVDQAGQTVVVTASAPVAPAPLEVAAGPDGAFSGTISLSPGTWELTVSSTGSDPMARRVTVTPVAGLVGTIELRDGESYLEIDQDGVPRQGVSGTIASPGDRIDVDAQREIRILAGNADAVEVSIGGVSIGRMGEPGAVIEWRITRNQ